MDKKVKQYTFTKQEMDFLNPRRFLLEQQNLIIESTKFVVETFIQSNVIKRIGIDPNKSNITYDLNKQIISVEDKVEIKEEDGHLPEETGNEKVSDTPQQGDSGTAKTEEQAN